MRAEVGGDVSSGLTWVGSSRDRASDDDQISAVGQCLLRCGDTRLVVCVGAGRTHARCHEHDVGSDRITHDRDFLR